MSSTNGYSTHPLEVGATQALRRNNATQSYPHELEVGATDVLRKHPTVHLRADHHAAVPTWLLNLEAKRPMLLREMIAEATGVFFFTYGGVSALAQFILTSAANEPGFGSLLNVAFGFSGGIALALITAATTSGGHFHCAFTLAFAIFQGFPWRKVPFYIFAQVLGGFMACFIVWVQWHQQIKQYEAGLRALGAPFVTATGPAGIFCAIPGPTQSNGYLFLIEFFCNTFIGLVVWGVLDPNNQFMVPFVAPFAIAASYFVMILGFGGATIALNTGRDLGARCFAAILYGREVFTVNNGYAAISGLTNIAATLLAILWYQLVFADSNKLIQKGHALPMEVHRELTKERTQYGGSEKGPLETYLRKEPTMRDDALKEGA